jgi:hypothetical protein
MPKPFPVADEIGGWTELVARHERQTGTTSTDGGNGGGAPPSVGEPGRAPPDPA